MREARSRCTAPFSASIEGERGGLQVEYGLTALGRLLSKTLTTLDRWVEKHHVELNGGGKR